jgi:hypothetical protein
MNFVVGDYNIAYTPKRSPLSHLIRSARRKSLLQHQQNRYHDKVGFTAVGLLQFAQPLYYVSLSFFIFYLSTALFR